MARRRGEVPQVPLLEAMPPELQAEASPDRCVCACCHPEMTEAERTAERAEQAEWHAARRTWLEQNGWSDMDLFWAEIDARRESTTPVRSGTKRRAPR